MLEFPQLVEDSEWFLVNSFVLLGLELLLVVSAANQFTQMIGITND